MNRDHQLTYCKVCAHKQMDPQKGIVCALTGNHATFENTCPTFLVAEGQEAPNPFQPKVYDAELHMATGTKRFLNYLIDLVVYYLFVLILFVVFFVFLGVFYPNDGTLQDGPTKLWSYVFVIITFLCYYTFCESVFGRTLGKLITGTRVVNKLGKTPDTKTIFFRTLARLVPFEAFSFLGSDPKGWHDQWTDTFVVNNK